ncbi:hypothetical protein ZWY2020_051164 [Hordeum vulgare]|nr:hypothetical protein ZWY2020_051164 [Hordeum vulgare]
MLAVPGGVRCIRRHPGVKRKPEAPPNSDPGMDGMLSVIAHELAEIASNPLANAWCAGGDPSFPTEIADLCKGIYDTSGGGTYTGQLLTDGRSDASYNLNGVGAGSRCIGSGTPTAASAPTHSTTTSFSSPHLAVAVAQ